MPTFTVSSSLTSVSFSVQVAVATLVKVPLVVATAVIVTDLDSPAAKSPIVIVSSSSLVKPSGRASTTTTPVASEGPLLVTTIVKVNSSPTITSALSTDLSIDKTT